MDRSVTQTIVAPVDENKLENELKITSDRAKNAEMKIVELRNQLEESRRETRMAIRVLGMEVGDSVDVHALLRSEGQAGWKGRAQQIQLLQKKVTDLKSQIAYNNTPSLPDTIRQAIATSDISDFDSVVMQAGDLSSTRRSTASSNAIARHADALRKLERDRKMENERLNADKQALERDLEDTKQRCSALKARNKTLQDDVKSLRDRVESLLDKSKHDDEFVQLLLKQQEMLKKNSLNNQNNTRPDSSAEKTNRTVSYDSKKIAELEATVTNLESELEKARAVANRNLSSAAPSEQVAVTEKDCKIAELETMLQASSLEAKHLGETIHGLHCTMDKMTEERLAVDAELAASRKSNAILERQIGKVNFVFSLKLVYNENIFFLITVETRH